MSEPDQEQRTRRLLWIVPIALLALIVIAVVAAFEIGSRRNLARAIARWQAAGERVEAGDFVEPASLDESNAAVLFRRAHGQLNITHSGSGKTLIGGFIRTQCCS